MYNLILFSPCLAFPDILWYYTHRAEDNIIFGELYFS